MIMHNAPMKRIALLILLLAPVALTGCQTIKAHNPFRHKEPAYQSAQQEQPLEVPPGMDQPPTTEALAIPDAGTGAAAAGMPSAQPEAGASPTVPAATRSVSGNSLTLGDTPASAYHRVGLALERGEVGQVTAHDDNAMTYQVAVDTVVTSKPQGGFFHRMFHRSKSETVKGAVTISVAPQGSGSVVQASGNPDAVARVMAVLQQRLQ
ncbi:MAG: hypothetical protein OJF55_000753 [Rhodanobacteraceae bacterium]|jgi:uncharacterized lipoprotein|nr:MAG: hypothetical protein OJF55_000753 [Rhodanobacteraceae bacterium]